MKNVIHELREIVSDYSGKINALTDAEFSDKPLPDKWSRKEVIGHLVDSAQNNLRRFICGQYETPAPLIVYDQDFWVNANQYQNMDRQDIIQLWRLLNLRICAVLENMPEGNYGKECNTGTLRSIEWLAADYVKHMKHHINQVISRSFDVTYR